MIMNKYDENNELRCSFSETAESGKKTHKRIRVYICDECIALCRIYSIQKNTNR